MPGNAEALATVAQKIASLQKEQECLWRTDFLQPWHKKRIDEIGKELAALKAQLNAS